MLGYLILLFTMVPVIELVLLIKVGQHIGAGSTIMIVIFTGVAGAYLARMQGLSTLQKIQNEVNQGQMPAERLFDGVLILCSGILLLTPGFITDLIGLMGLLPLTRNLLKKWLKRKTRDMVDRGEVITITSFKSM
jgi:UPF0716 protein FxsA